MTKLLSGKVSMFTFVLSNTRKFPDVRNTTRDPKLPSFESFRRKLPRPRSSHVDEPNANNFPVT